jgi:uncharacterized protein (TIGR02996 family)
MNIEEALLADMIEHRDDDTPRLVCADWYEEHGQAERAELIRVQCQLARLSASAPERSRLQIRERELLADHAVAWAEPLDGFGVTEWRFERGFIEAVEINLGSTFRWGLREMCRLAPLRDVRLVDPDLDLDDLEGGLPDLERFEGLEVSFPYLSENRPAQLRRLIRSPHLEHLRRLGLHSLDYYPFEESLFESLLASPVLSSLEELYVSRFEYLVSGAVRSLAERLATLPLRVLVLRAQVSFSHLLFLLQRLPVTRFRGLGLIDFVMDDPPPSNEALYRLPWHKWRQSLDWLVLRPGYVYPSAFREWRALAQLAQPLLARDPFPDDQLWSWRGQRPSP